MRGAAGYPGNLGRSIHLDDGYRSSTKARDKKGQHAVRKKILTVISVFALAIPLIGGCKEVYADSILSQTFNDPTANVIDIFGWSVALDGNNVLIGAPGDDTNGRDAGQAHLFNATTGALLQTFNDPTVTSGDGFGYSVALEGNNALIGAYRDDSMGADVGQAYLFDVTTGALLRTFNDPTVTVTFGGDRFGSSVALDGNNVLIGAPFDDTKGADVGQAYLFDATTGALLQTFNDPTVNSQGQFGK